jgi:NSS family neurotransmitter:Na+ symporter
LVLTIILVFWSVTLEGAGEGLKAYVTPDFSVLSEPKVWIDAYSQIFFTLSLGFGIMIAYASYLPDKANLTGSAILTVLINSGYSLFAGCAVFAVLGFMAASEGKAISEVVTQSIGLAFVAYPKAISLMPGGNLFGAVFFLCLTVAGLSSAISIMEAFVSAVVDKFGVDRRMLVTGISALGFLGSIVFASQAGLLWLDIVDHYLTHYGLIIVGILECIVVGWLFNLSKLREHINRVSTIQLGSWWEQLIKFFVPAVLAIICLGDLYNELQQPYGDYSWTSLILIGRDWLLATFALAFIFSMQPWKTGNLSVRGRNHH